MQQMWPATMAARRIRDRLPDMNLDNIDLTAQERIEADLHNLTDEQAKFNHWFNENFHFHGSEAFLDPPIKITKTKCLGWRILPTSILGCNRQCFRGWDIGHCLNCDADPYDCQSLAWRFDGGGYHGALLKCNKCNQLRWQPRDLRGE